ncbi:head-to-tail adaptor [Mycobacterium phage Brusacoram]|uniref:Head-to-tail adaptor n=15 Tax=Caudoviricetes TaxID=2731619 RepID=A0A0K1Y6M1_9CAUD|nr:head-to-tail adaptor [Mycobacterium phage Fishburne]YP_009125963.1 head-to-tail connector complex protein [Mycobacterium phage Malithi]YP_009193905.1 head-to-tail adaptor [Mycobacterium phage Brusacoram]YP_009303766.1 head-to-tail adaptor [Mycobacterium phage Shipwreck]YP_009964183.1 head-to-tail adaptor [Mycobacterium phage Willsammy]YP_009964263.1 head-to-tail adaptor [Mycobacterium phage Megiddo]YP_009964341.1 head-to-tail adaptor [Mycobacterium phage Atcoo]YP_009964496.1 head-to-tail 
MADFLTVETLAEWAKQPAWADSDLARALLTVVSDWIRDHKPGLADDDPAAQVVVFEVTRDALLAGDLGPYSSVTKTTSHSSRQVTIDRAVVDMFITPRHRRMLGLGSTAAPRGHFPKNDY